MIVGNRMNPVKLRTRNFWFCLGRSRVLSCLKGLLKFFNLCESFRNALWVRTRIYSGECLSESPVFLSMRSPSLVHVLHAFMPWNDLCNNCERLDVVDVGSFRIIVLRVFFSLRALVVRYGTDKPGQGTSWQMSTTHGWGNHLQYAQAHLPPGSVCPEAGFCRCHRLPQSWWWNTDVGSTLTAQHKLKSALL